MVDNQLSLYFSLKPGEKADFEIISAAAISWVETMRAAARALDPTSDIKVHLIDADESSLIFNTVLEWFDRNIGDKLEHVERGYKSMPRGRKLAIALAAFLIVTGYPTWHLYFGKGGVFADEDEELIRSEAEKIISDPAVETSRKKFYRTLEREPAVTAVGLKEHPEDAAPFIVIPREKFPEASGLWSSESDDQELKITYPVLDVVLVKPALVHTPRSWTFKPEGLPEFDAVMKDVKVLQAIQDSGFPETLREGISMTVRLEIREELVDGKWKLMRGGRSVMRVLSPKLD